MQLGFRAGTPGTSDQRPPAFNSLYIAGKQISGGCRVGVLFGVGTKRILTGYATFYLVLPRG